MSTPLLQQFPSLASYPPNFLKDLLSSPELTEAFLFTLPEVQELVAEIERLGQENDAIAKKNLEIRDELLTLREGTAQSYGHAQALKHQWAEIEKAQNTLYQKHRPSFLHLRLRHSITAQDDLSEKIASAFIEGRTIPSSLSAALAHTDAGGYSNSTAGSRVDSPAFGQSSFGGSSTPVPDRSQNKAIEDFITEFKAARKTYHKRAIWAERWTRGEVAWRDD